MSENTNLRTGDSSTVQHGRWELVGSDYPKKIYQCSVCQRKIECTDEDISNYPYCHCGAKMDAKDDFFPKVPVITKEWFDEVEAKREKDRRHINIIHAVGFTCEILSVWIVAGFLFGFLFSILFRLPSPGAYVLSFLLVSVVVAIILNYFYQSDKEHWIYNIPKKKKK